MTKKVNIKIPFTDRMTLAVLEGKKTVTSRNKKYGMFGDVFGLFDKKYMLIRIQMITLQEVKAKYWKEEGFKSPDDFEECWNKLHPRKKFVPTQKVFLHFFKEIE